MENTNGTCLKLFTTIVPAHLDLDSKSEATEHAQESSIDYLRKEGTGCMGMLEKIPIGIKLFCSSCFAASLILVLGLWLIVLYALSTKTAREANAFLVAYTRLTPYISSLQSSRFYLASHMNNPTNKTYQNWKAQMGFIASNSSFANDYLASIAPTATQGMKKQLSHIFQQQQVWQSVAQMVLDATIDPLEAYNTICAFVEHLQDTFTVIIQENALRRSTQTLDLFIRLRDTAGKLRSFGVLAFSSTRNASTNAYYQTMFTTYISRRTALMELFEIFATQESLAKYEDLFELPATRSILELESIAITAPTEKFRDAVNPSQWAANMSIVVESMQNIYPDLYAAAANELRDEITISTAAIIGISVVVAACFVSYWLFSLLFSQTIVGPWQRMSLLLETVVNKFVPKAMIKQLHVSRILEITLNQNKSVQQTLLLFYFEQEHANIEAVNETISSYSAAIYRFGGYIDNFKGRGFLACFTHARDALKAALTITEQATAAKMQVHVVLHGAENVKIGVIGDCKRMQVSVISHHVAAISAMLPFCKKHDITMLVSDSLVKMVPETKYFKKSMLRIAHRDALDTHWYEWITPSSPFAAVTSMLNDAVRAVYNFSYFEAIPILQSILQTMHHTSAKHWLKVCTTAIELLKSNMADVDIMTLLANDQMRVAFEQFLIFEKSEENMQLWKRLQDFLDHPTLAAANDIKLNYLDTTDINLSGATKKRVSQGIQQGLLDDVKRAIQVLNNEILIVMQDAFSRFKTKDEFKIAFVKQAQLDILALAQ